LAIESLRGALAKTNRRLILILLIIASGICGLLLGRFFRVYALLPAALLIIAPAWYLGQEQGFSTGMLAFVLSAALMQVCYFASLMTHLLIQNLSVIENVPSEAAQSPPELSWRG
jgi:hypothetical protein